MTALPSCYLKVNLDLENPPWSTASSSLTCTLRESFLEQQVKHTHTFTRWKHRWLIFCEAVWETCIWSFLLIEKIERTVQIEASTVEIEERGVKLRLTVVDTPGYGDAINSQDWWEILVGWRLMSRWGIFGFELLSYSCDLRVVMTH